MKVVCLLGSPRAEGNSAAIANRLLETAKNYCAEIQIFNLYQLDYCGCKACNNCKKNQDRCVIDDGLSQVLNSVYDADVVILATPVYFDGVSSKISAFVERTCSYFKVDWPESESDCRLAPGKKLVFIQTQGKPESAGQSIYPRYVEHFEMLGFKQRYLLRACELIEPDDIKGNKDILQTAEETAQKIFIR